MERAFGRPSQCRESDRQDIANRTVRPGPGGHNRSVEVGPDPVALDDEAPDQALPRGVMERLEELPIVPLQKRALVHSASVADVYLCVPLEHARAT